MSKLRCHISISLDGYVAGPAQSAEDPLGVGSEELHDWVEQTSSDGARRVDRSWSIAHVHGSGRACLNVPDLRLDGWAHTYHGENLPRLIAARNAYDTERLFRSPHTL
jgi:hypothetical protein